jgi:hypothetical protein
MFAFVVPTKTCNHCNEVKPLARFRKDKKCVDGHRSRCEDCNNKRQQSWRKQEKETNKKIVAFEQSCKPTVEQLNEKQVALPRTFHRTGTYYPDNSGYVRNLGNKHIKSVGF